MFTEFSPILGPPSASFDQVVAYILARSHGEYSDHAIRNIIAPTYYQICFDVHVDPTLAVAQMIHETGNLTSFWASRPQRNPAGIGVNGLKRAAEAAGEWAPPDPGNPQRRVQTTQGEWAFNTQRQQWEVGLSFASWQDDSIPAQVGRLLAYALPRGAENAAQRTLIERALRYRMLPNQMRGSAPLLRALGRAHNPTGQGWASPGTDYGARIAAIAEQIRQTRA